MNHILLFVALAVVGGLKTSPNEVNWDVEPSGSLTCQSSSAECKWQLDHYAIYTQRRLATLITYMNTIKTQFGDLMNSAGYKSLQENITSLSNAQQNYQTRLSARRSDVDRLRNNTVQTRDTLQSTVNDLLKSVKGKGETMEQEFNQVLAGMVNLSKEQLQKLADLSYDKSVGINQQNWNDVTQFLNDLKLSFVSPYQQLNMSKYQMDRDFESVSGLLRNATDEYDKTDKAFTTLKEQATQVATDYVNTYAPIDLETKTQSLVSSLNDTAINVHLADITKKYDDALNFPGTGLRGRLTEFLESERAELKTLENNFNRNSSSIRTSAMALLSLPAQEFQSILTNLTKSETVFKNAEASFHNNLILALASANSTYLSTSTAAKKSRDDLEAEWSGITQFLTTGSTNLSAQVIQKLAALDVDATNQIAQTSSAGAAGAEQMTDDANAIKVAIEGNANATTTMLATAGASASAQMESINQLLSMDAASLNATLSLFSDFLNARTQGMNNTFGGALNDLGKVLGDVSSQVGSASKDTRDAIVGEAAATINAVGKELEAIAATGKLSADQLSGLYEAAAKNNAAEFAEIAQQLGLLSNSSAALELDIRTLSTTVKDAVVGADTVVKEVREGMAKVLEESSGELTALRGSLGAAVATSQKLLVDMGDEEVNALHAAINPNITNLKTQLQSLQNMLSGKTAEYNAVIPEFQKLSEGVRAKVEGWLARVDDSKNKVKAEADTKAADLEVFWKTLVEEYKTKSSDLLAASTEAVKSELKDKIALLNSTSIYPAIERLSDLTRNTQNNVTAVEYLLKNVEGVLGKLDTLQGLVTSEVAGKFSLLQSEYAAEVSKHGAAVAGVQASVASTFDKLDKDISELNAGIASAKTTVENQAKAELSKLSTDLTEAVAASSRLIADLVTLIDTYKKDDAEYFAGLQTAEEAKVEEAKALLASVKTEVAGTISENQHEMQTSNAKLVMVLNHLAQVLVDANVTSSEASASLKAFASALANQTAAVADSVADRLGATDVSGLAEKLNAGSTGILASGTSAISAAVEAVADAADATTMEALTRSGNLVSALESTAAAYADSSANAGQVSNVTLGAIAALITAFKANQTNLSDWVDQETAEKIKENQDINVVLDLWNNMTTQASEDAQSAVEDVNALITAVHSDVDAKLGDMETAVTAVASNATANANASWQKMEQLAKVKQPIQAGILDNFDAVIDDMNKKVGEVTDKKTKTLSDISMLRNTASGEINTRFSKWLLDFQNAFAEDIAKYSGGTAF